MVCIGNVLIMVAMTILWLLIDLAVSRGTKILLPERLMPKKYIILVPVGDSTFLQFTHWYTSTVSVPSHRINPLALLDNAFLPLGYPVYDSPRTTYQHRKCAHCCINNKELIVSRSKPSHSRSRAPLSIAGVGIFHRDDKYIRVVRHSEPKIHIRYTEPRVNKGCSYQLLFYYPLPYFLLLSSWESSAYSSTAGEPSELWCLGASLGRPSPSGSMRPR